MQILCGYGQHYNRGFSRKKEESILCCTVQEEDQFLCKIGSLLTVFTWAAL